MDNVCIIGLGSIGRRHAKVLKQKGVEKIIGVDVRDDRIAQAKEETEISKVPDIIKVYMDPETIVIS